LHRRAGAARTSGPTPAPGTVKCGGAAKRIARSAECGRAAHERATAFPQATPAPARRPCAAGGPRACRRDVRRPGPGDEACLRPSSPRRVARSSPSRSGVASDPEPGLPEHRGAIASRAACAEARAMSSASRPVTAARCSSSSRLRGRSRDRGRAHDRVGEWITPSPPRSNPAIIDLLDASSTYLSAPIRRGGCGAGEIGRGPGERSTRAGGSFGARVVRLHPTCSTTSSRTALWSSGRFSEP